jgi:hypothetical protein
VTALGGRRFRRANGREIGKPKWYPDYLIPRTDEVEDIVKRARSVILAVKACRQVGNYLLRVHGDDALAARRYISGDLVDLAFETSPPRATGDAT